MREPVARSVGLLLTLGYATLIGWLFVSQPRTMAEAVGGRLWVESQPGDGTTIVIQTPVNGEGGPLHL